MRPFLVTSWSGHRNDPDIPEPVRHVWKQKFRPSPHQPKTRQRNGDFALLDPEGKVVSWFDAVGPSGPGRPNDLVQNTVDQLKRASRRLGLPAQPRRFKSRSALKLPEPPPGTLGLRIFVRLDDRRMPAYRFPVVEVVEMAPADWNALSWPSGRRSVDASKFKKWLSQVYPPGVMERVDPVTKKAYVITGVSGQLSLAPSVSSARHRHAVAIGRVRLSDSGTDGFGYEGTLELVMTYAKQSSEVISMKGFFRGSYPRQDRQRQMTRLVPLEAVFESRPR